MSFDRKWTPPDAAVDSDDEEQDDTQYKSQKDAILFAIHVTESMLAVPDVVEDDEEDSKKRKEEPVSAARTALECAYQILQSRIISNPNDMMGILLFGTEATDFHGDTSSSSGFAHCYMLMDLDVPEAKGIKALKDLLYSETQQEWNDLMVPCKGTVSLANVLFGANQDFTTKAANFQSRRLFIVTDDDNPHAHDKAARNSAITRARDLYDLGVQIDPFYISTPGRAPFDASKFYDDIVYRSQDDEEQLVPFSGSGASRLKDMVSSIRSKSTPKRSLFSTQLEIGPGLTIGVNGYVLYRRQEKARSHYVYTGGEKAVMATGQTTKIAEETAREVDKTETQKAYRFGGEQIVFTAEEMKQMRQFGEPVIRIIGFKPQAAVRFDYNLQPSRFVYPNERDYVGSTRTFAALHKKLLVAQKVAIAWCVVRRSAVPMLAALWPSEEQLENGTQVVPAGLHIIRLPFADDMRQNPESSLQKASPALIDKMRAVVKQLHMPKGYAPEKYSNPSLQWFYRILQAIALEDEMPEQLPDPTLPKYKSIQRHVGEQVVEWGQELDGLAADLPVVAADTGSKRKRPKDEEGGSKKAKVAGGDVDLKQAYAKGTLSKYTVAQLKEGMKGLGLDVGGRKGELVERIEAFFDTK